MITQSIYNMASVGQHSPVGLDIVLDKAKFKVFTDLLEQFTLQVGDILTQGGDLIYAAISLEVGHELNDGLEQLGAIAVLASGDEETQLVVGSGQHLQTLQGGHGHGEIAFCSIEALDIEGHVGNGKFGLLGALADILDVGEESSQVRLGLLYSLDAVRVGSGLTGDEGGDAIVEVTLVLSEAGRDTRDGREGGRVGEDGVEVMDWVIVDWE